MEAIDSVVAARDTSRRELYSVVITNIARRFDPLPMTPVFDIYWADNDTLHDDMVVRLGSEFYLCDSYWLAVLAPEGRDTQSGARRVFASMCKRAAKEFSSHTDDWTRFFPFGFFDQCMQWLRIKRFADELEIGAGWGDDGTHTFSPAGSAFPERVSGWQPVSIDPTRTSLESFCAELRRISCDPSRTER